jgi:hypothetical protein
VRAPEAPHPGRGQGPLRGLVRRPAPLAGRSERNGRLCPDRVLAGPAVGGDMTESQSGVWWADRPAHAGRGSAAPAPDRRRAVPGAGRRGHPGLGMEDPPARERPGRLQGTRHHRPAPPLRVADPDEVAAFLLLTREANTPAGGSTTATSCPGGSGPTSTWSRRPTLIRTYEGQFIPGLLQTDDYMRAVVQRRPPGRAAGGGGPAGAAAHGPPDRC